jgi:(2Fe-2S) ferredoxin
MNEKILQKIDEIEENFRTINSLYEEVRDNLRDLLKAYSGILSETDDVVELPPFKPTIFKMRDGRTTISPPWANACPDGCNVYLCKEGVVYATVRDTEATPVRRASIDEYIKEVPQDNLFHLMILLKDDILKRRLYHGTER